MTEMWAPATHGFPPQELDDFLLWAADRGASDIAFQTGSPAWIEVDGLLSRATEAQLDSPTIAQLAEQLSPAGDTILRAGRPIDCSHAVQITRRRNRRFRVNIAAVQVAEGFGMNITMRVLPDGLPTVADLGIEPEILDAWDRCHGLTLVTGVPGSGKSTLLAAGTRRLLEAGAGRIQTCEAPIEFVYDSVSASASLMSQSEVPRHFASFAEALRASLRRRPSAILVGEARDRETIEAVLRAADTGIAVYSTTHTVGVAATIRRLINEFPLVERHERAAALVDVLNMVVTQALVPNPAGGRTALREWLVFDETVKTALLEAPHERWHSITAEVVAATGHSLQAAAIAAHRAGRIGHKARLRYAPSPNMEGE